MPIKMLAEMKTEAEEARWFEDNQDRLLKLFEQAEKEAARSRFTTATATR